MAKDKQRHLEELRARNRSCPLKMAEAALRAWGFTEGRRKRNVRVWNYKHVTLTLHAPHGKAGNNMDPGAVAMVIRKIEEADVIQQEERNAENGR